MPIQKRFSSCSDFLSETSEANRSFTVSRAETGVYSNSSSDTGEYVRTSSDSRDSDNSSGDNRDSLESGYSSGGKKDQEYLPMESKASYVI